MKTIEVKDLCFGYTEDYDVIKNVSFEIEKGSYTTFIGHNGSGKSTIAKLLVGLLGKRSGDIFIDGIELNMENLSQIRQRVGIVFQNPDNQFIGATVRDDIAFGLENHNFDPKEMDDIINSFAAQVSMTDYLDSEPTNLSGGQKQRVAIAGILAMSPDILIFDEATSMLDPKGKDEINTLIQNLHKEKQLTIISITHDIEEVAKANQVIVLNKGQIVMQGKPEDILVREKELKSLSLDIPFAYELSQALRKNGVKVHSTIDAERLVDEICQLSSKN